jgi:hypothetical protein
VKEGTNGTSWPWGKMGENALRSETWGGQGGELFGLSAHTLHTSFHRRSHLATQPERSNQVCGTTAEALALPLHPPPEEPVVIRTHALDAHGVNLEPLERLTQLGAPWTLADGRVSRREVPPEAIYAGVGVANPHRRRGRLFGRA